MDANGRPPFAEPPVGTRSFDRTSGSDTALNSARRHVAGLAAQLRVPLSQVTTAAIPFFDAALRPPPNDRKAALAKHLRKTIKAAFRETPDVTPTAPANDVDTPDLTVGAACAACRGLCCISGGKHHAFLTPEVIDRYRATRPQLDADQVLQDYLDAQPARIAEGSCLYHGPKGCGLSRDMRSELCNRYECGDLQAAPRGSRSPVAVVAHTHGTPWTVSMVTPDGRSATQKLIDD